MFARFTQQKIGIILLVNCKALRLIRQILILLEITVTNGSASVTVFRLFLCVPSLAIFGRIFYSLNTMPLNTSQDAIIDNRRRLVASLRLRGATQREIVNQLDLNGQRNPKTGKPWSLGIVNSDLQALEAQWKSEAAKDISDHKARQLAELGEVKRAGWGVKDLSSVLRAIKQEAEILGTVTNKVEHTGPGGNELVIRVKYDDAGNNSNPT